MKNLQQKTPRDLTLRGSMRFKKRVFCSPCKSTAIDFSLYSTDSDGMNGAGLLYPKNAYPSKLAVCQTSKSRLFLTSNWSNK